MSAHAHTHTRTHNPTVSWVGGWVVGTAWCGVSLRPRLCRAGWLPQGLESTCTGSRMQMQMQEGGPRLLAFPLSCPSEPLLSAHPTHSLTRDESRDAITAPPSVDSSWSRLLTKLAAALCRRRSLKNPFPKRSGPRCASLNKDDASGACAGKTGEGERNGQRERK